MICCTLGITLGSGTGWRQGWWRHRERTDQQAGSAKEAWAVVRWRGAAWNAMDHCDASDAMDHCDAGGRALPRRGRGQTFSQTDRLSSSSDPTCLLDGSGDRE